MELLQVTRNTLCDWVRRGRIAAIRVGNAYVFDPHVLADWLGKRQTTSAPGRSA
jgi:excisionase family DNA binding protein